MCWCFPKVNITSPTFVFSFSLIQVQSMDFALKHAKEIFSDSTISLLVFWNKTSKNPITEDKFQAGLVNKKQIRAY